MMKKLKMTAWYPGNVRPAHVGVYETAPQHGHKWFKFWNGSWWGYAANNVQRAFEWRDVRSAHQCDDWRGLTAPAK
jgi:hypothetical protein